MGCASSTAIVLPPALTFANKIEVVPWGVLGDVMGGAKGPWSTKEVAPKPDATTLIVDPASLNIVRDPYFRPAEAGGAAGAIYRFLGIDSNAAFPADVAAALGGVGDAMYKRYGYPHAIHVIHVIGPDFKAQEATQAEAIEQLSHAYASVLRVARDEPRKLLRLCPVSSGIYAGSHRAKMPEITAQALLKGFHIVADEDPSRISRMPCQADGCVAVELCMFEGVEAVKEFKLAMRHAMSEEEEASQA